MVVDGKKLQKEILKGLKRKFKGKKLSFVSILLKEEKPTQKFLKSKQKIASLLGVDYQVIKLDSNISLKKLKKEIEKISKNFDGVSIQLPLPKRFQKNLKEVLDFVPKEKDVECLNSEFSQKKYFKKIKIFPPSVEVLRYLLKRFKISLKNKKIVIVGEGTLIGKPIINFLKEKKIPFEVVRKETPKKKKVSLLKKADIVISGVGKAWCLDAKILKKGAVVIDFGCAFKKGKLYGDIKPPVDFKKFRLFTPTPGGTGPILVAMVFRNLLFLSSKTGASRN